MGILLRLVRRARRSYRGSMALAFGLVVAMAVLTGTTAGVLPAVIGRALGVVAGAEAPGAPTGAFGSLASALMPEGSTWLVVVITLCATVVTVGIGVLASRMGSGLSGDVTAAMRIEMMRAVLSASARDVEEVGRELTRPRRPPGLEAESRPPAAEAPPGAKAPGAKAALRPEPAAAAPTPGAKARTVPSGAKLPPGAKAPPGAKVPGVKEATRTAVVKLAVSREAALVSDFVVSVSTGLPQSVATLLVLGVELVSSGAWLVLVGGLGLFGLSRLFADRASRRVGDARRALQHADAAVFGNLQETLSASEDLRLWGARGQAVGEFAEVAHECAAARARFASALAVSGQIKSVFTAMAPLLLVVALQLSGRTYGPGEVAKLVLLVPLLMLRLEALDAIRQGMIERGPILKAAEHLLALPASPPPAAEPKRLDLASVRGHLRFEGVRYTPPGAAAPVLDGIDLDIPAGSFVAICGSSGSGKSSLLRLLLRLDDPDEGRILVDGTDLRDLDPAQLPSLFGVVRQSAQLLQRPIGESIALGLEPPPSDDDKRAALRAVHLDELAEPGSGRDLDTPYRRHPPSFSGGEHRRLLVARMVLQGAPIGVLDEPEAGLPAGTAQQILATIREQAAGRTHLVVTHAPHLVDSDFNLVMEAGRVVGQGRHAELARENAPYARLLAQAERSD